MSFIVIADIESLLNVVDAGMLPRLAALGADIIIPRPLYNQLLPSSTADLVDSLTPIVLVGPDERNRRRCAEITPMLAGYYLELNGRERMRQGEAGVLIVPQRHPWFSPRRLGNLRTLLVDEYLDVAVQKHFQDVADGQRGIDELIALLAKAPDVPPDPGDEMPD